MLEAGLWAPCAGNLQAVKFVVVQDKRLNDELGKINRELFGAAEINIGSVCISRGEKTFETELGKKSKEKWGLDSTYKCHSIIPLGYISKNGKPQPRKENRIIFD
ncbi:nitroreductase family protein [Clostridium beijerinckii]|uniref:nitroreductase family protein n=1 Tax=Clostridium beijerinckii TaxID=1520 RepID=UPI00232BCD46|nr:nitroreductase family protein [Clostridium beijerinckii]